MLLKNILQVGASILILKRILQLLEACKNSCHIEIRCLFGTVAGAVHQRKIAFIIHSIHLERNDMVDITLMALKVEIDGIFTDKTSPVLGLMQAPHQILAFFLCQSI
jgi:hypothetical protein